MSGDPFQKPSKKREISKEWNGRYRKAVKTTGEPKPKSEPKSHDPPNRIGRYSPGKHEKRRRWSWGVALTLISIGLTAAGIILRLKEVGG